MKYKYTGDGEITLRDVTFHKNRAKVVDDPALARKLDNLPYFERVDGDDD